MQSSKTFRPDQIGSYFRMEWLSLALVTVSGLIYNVGLLATPWFEGRLAQCPLPSFWAAMRRPPKWRCWCWPISP